MRVLCRHGHFSFYPRAASDIARFSNFFGVSLKREQDYFTFEGLIDAPKYSLTGMPYVNLPAITTYEGEPWDVMRENGFVYDLRVNLLVPKLSVVAFVELPQVGFYFRAGGSLIQPGSRTLLGRQILSYSGEFVEEGFSLRVLEYDYE
jgi:hypothetical protein